MKDETQEELIKIMEEMLEISKKMMHFEKEVTKLGRRMFELREERNKIVKESGLTTDEKLMNEIKEMMDGKGQMGG